jgi:hypothetical protein
MYTTVEGYGSSILRQPAPSPQSFGSSNSWGHQGAASWNAGGRGGGYRRAYGWERQRPRRRSPANRRVYAWERQRPRQRTHRRAPGWSTLRCASLPARLPRQWLSCSLPSPSRIRASSRARLGARAAASPWFVLRQKLRTPEQHVLRSCTLAWNSTEGDKRKKIRS